MSETTTVHALVGRVWRLDARVAELESEVALCRDELASMTAQHDELHDLWLDAEQGKTEAEAEVDTLKRTLRIAAADYWREQMDGLDTDHPVDHIIDATIAKWIARTKESKGGVDYPTTIPTQSACSSGGWITTASASSSSLPTSTSFAEGQLRPSPSCKTK